MKKRVVFFHIILIVTILLTSCAANDTAQQPGETTTPDSQVATQPQNPSTDSIPEISEDEMILRFESVYSDCGADVTQPEETLAAELEALKSSVADSDMRWPDDYEDQYLRWRTRIVNVWWNGLYKSYWDIISQRQPYTYGEAGLVYADYIDAGQSGTPGLMLLSWAPGEDYDQILTLELYGEENGKAVARWKKDITVRSFAPSANISFATRNNQLFLWVSYYLQSSVEVQNQNEFYALTMESNGDAEKLSYWADRFGMEGYRKGDSKITEGEYQVQLAAYSAGQQIMKLGRLYNGEVPKITTDGILSGKNEVYAEIEVNGTAVELSGSAYVYGNPCSSDEIMVPLRSVLEAMGIAVHANSDASVIIASTQEDTLVIANKDYSVVKSGSSGQTYENYRCYFNGGQLGELPYVVMRPSDGGMFASLHGLASLFGATVERDNDAAVIRITSNIPDSSRMSQAELEKMANFNFDQAAQIAEKEGYPGFSSGGGTPVHHYSFEYVSGRLIFAYGKAICVGYVLVGEEHYDGDEDDGGGYYAEWYRVDVMHDGTVIAHPYDKVQFGVG